MKLSAHFELEEFTFSATARSLGINNTPPLPVLGELQKTAEKMELVRALLDNRPIQLTSGYRCKALNDALPNASPTSAHMWGGAADFVCPAFGTPLEICRYLATFAASLDFDQIIQEGTWVHLGRAPAGDKPRRQVLTKGPGNTYREGLD